MINFQKELVLKHYPNSFYQVCAEGYFIYDPDHGNLSSYYGCEIYAWNEVADKIKENKNMKRSIEITKEEAQQLLKSGDETSKILAIAAWPELDEPKYPEWEDIGIRDGYTIRESIIVEAIATSPSYGKHLWLTKDLAEAVLALSQLTQLAAAWDKVDLSCKPDWDRCGIINERNKVVTVRSLSRSIPLTFRYQETAKKFIEKYKDLLETAKPLL